MIFALYTSLLVTVIPLKELHTSYFRALLNTKTQVLALSIDSVTMIIQSNYTIHSTV